ncbi:ATP-binding protein [Chloroflexota bacterium]
MKEVVVLSGKGGTGKTSLVGSFAALAKSKVLVDCDVDAADLHLLLHPVIRQKHEFWSGYTAFIDEGKCTRCGLCQDLCRFKAIKDFRVDTKSCEGCGFCFQVCPAEAVTMKENMAGHWFMSDSGYGTLLYAGLGVAQDNSGKLVTLVRQQAREAAEKEGADYLISDGPPGIGCPVISSLSGVDLALVVTEPTLTGIHDLERVLDVCYHFKVKALVCINKYDINKDNTRQIEDYCYRHGIEVVSRIPFDNVVTEAMVEGLPVIEYRSGEVSQQLDLLWGKVAALLAKN